MFAYLCISLKKKSTMRTDFKKKKKEAEEEKRENKRVKERDDKVRDI